MRKKQVREREEGEGDGWWKGGCCALPIAPIPPRRYCYSFSSSDPIYHALLLFAGLWVKLGPH